MDKPASLKDVLNYQPETYFSQDEITLIKSTFGNNPRLLNLLRKALLPTVSDPSLPIEQFDNDAFLSGRNWAQIPDNEVKILACAREDAIKFVMGGLVRLKVMASVKEENDIEASYRRSKDSTK